MKQLIFLSLIFLFSFTFGSQAVAQSPTPRGIKVRSEVREDMCQRVTDKIEERRERFAEHRDNRANIYRGVIHRLNNLMTKLKDRGCDASQVKTDLTTLEKLIDELVVAFNLFLDKLHAVGIPVCQEAPGDWKAAMAEVHTQLQAAKDKQKEIRAFYKNTLKPHVKAAGQACKASPAPSPEATP